MIQVILSALVIWNIGLVHPFHISICEIEHDGETKSLQITSRIFQDDFETALEPASDVKDYFGEKHKAEAEKALKSYFEEHLKVQVNNKPLKHKLLGYEIEDDVVWSYLEIQQVSSIEEIEVQYSVLIDTFADQINLTHIRYQGEVKSLKFQRHQLNGTAVFTD